jgi:hypothetical protein
MPQFEMAEEEAGVGTGATATERRGPGVRRFEDERGHERKGAGGWQQRDEIAVGKAWTSAVVEHTGARGRRRRGTDGFFSRCERGHVGGEDGKKQMESRGAGGGPKLRGWLGYEITISYPGYKI